jgi:predicted permease
VITQVALACGLLVLSAVFVKSAVSLRATTFPFPVRGVLTAEVVPSSPVQQDDERRTRLIRDLTQRTQAVPGVRAAALISALPGRGGGNWSFTLDVTGEDATAARTYTALSFVTPGFLAVLESGVVRGRDIDWRDDQNAPAVALVNESWVARWSPDREPLGRIIEIGARRMEIVGVVPDLLPRDIEEEQQHGVYAPYLQREGPINVRLMARGPADALALVQPMRAAIVAVDPDLPVEEFATLYDAIFADKKILDAFSMLFFVFGLGALFLTIIGIYGVVSFSVSRRTREIGVRVALGARGSDIARLVLGDGGRQIAIGGAVGMLLAWALSRALASAIEPVLQADMLIFTAVLAMLVITGLIALLVPTRRALSVEPVRALRSE